MRPNRLTITLILAGICILIASYKAIQYFSSPLSSEVHTIHAQITSRLFELQLPDSDGNILPLSGWRNKILVINFWATWCPPCRKEMPALIDVSQRFKNEPVQFIGLSIDNAHNVSTFKQKFAVPYPLLIAPQSTLDLTKALGNPGGGLPATLILDHSGTIRHFRLGLLSAPELESIIRPLLNTDQS